MTAPDKNIKIVEATTANLDTLYTLAKKLGATSQVFQIRESSDKAPRIYCGHPFNPMSCYQRFTRWISCKTPGESVCWCITVMNPSDVAKAYIAKFNLAQHVHFGLTKTI